jgi:quercetin dioxygenase-like cupin family protein
MDMMRASHAMAAPVLHFGLQDEIRRLRGEAGPGSGSGGRNAITLVKDGPLRVVLILLRAGASMEEHAAPGPATVHVLGGRVRIGAQTDECTCAAGGIVVFNGGIAHTVTAEEESTLLLTLIDARILAGATGATASREHGEL